MTKQWKNISETKGTLSQRIVIAIAIFVLLPLIYKAWN